MSPPLLIFRDLVHGFGGLPVLRGVSGRVATGELLLVRGANGSGKSTLVRCLAGLLRPQSGEIELQVDGQLHDSEARRQRIGWVGPGLAFYESLTAEENLGFHARLRGIEPDHGLALLRDLGVPAHRAAGALSSGMLQRLRWSFALQHRPPVLLLDEPFQNLDAAGEEAVQALLSAHLERGSLAVVASPIQLGLSTDRVLDLTDISAHSAAGERASGEATSDGTGS
ncbi:MAG: ABC transporter ATP-binding protein [Thermoanaerobaculia bacterium]|nr:ABC transporter ATP-binding protein [Thermoanaerobaculia bacterium]